jgi:hypothetical protein
MDDHSGLKELYGLKWKDKKTKSSVLVPEMDSCDQRVAGEISLVAGNEGQCLRELIERDFGLLHLLASEELLQHGIRAAPRRIGCIGGQVDTLTSPARHDPVLPLREVLVLRGQLRDGLPKCDVQDENQEYPLGRRVWGKERCVKITTLRMQRVDVPEQGTVREGKTAPRAVEVVNLGFASDLNAGAYKVLVKATGQILTSNQLGFTFRKEELVEAPPSGGC